MRRNIYKHQFPWMLKGKVYRALDRVFSFGAAFIDLRTKHKRTAPLMRMHTQYSEIMTDVTGNMDQQIWYKK